ncbi:hypothetical protein SLEP1_g36736 [Rubroshorea leprosula]|uniref:Uncharacterized protein n=1 Tax=Rubroshorea leprosula TaxID=152421 RepID=A0AAV5KSF3_9ROSI|nr:hypothetical protein SLEP1_g36736 [Rubroshorea leprosula]
MASRFFSFHLSIRVLRWKLSYFPGLIFFILKAAQM